LHDRVSEFALGQAADLLGVDWRRNSVWILAGDK
jgi:hypothetical protein